ncbi:hypothetical protein GOBAR_AA31021 [Gossypium barbadense]|uniref:PPM-type phosphatase domain-containing protein n=1 Tax=Gossypium barbadense TaxID=3634 RepID=A0A2P5WF08_GOSBA|nr:hypothetical protein GOBAR_AA31021 [Gossypium barbadense]
MKVVSFNTPHFPSIITNRYVEWYNSRGIHVITFLVELKDLLCLDPVSMLDQRIAELANRLATWGSEKEEDGRERSFILEFCTWKSKFWHYLADMESYLDIADKMLMENPELALMGSCVLVMLMKGGDVNVTNVGDSSDGDKFSSIPDLTAFQLSVDHNTNEKEEVQRIKNEHPDDPCVVMNDRVKGSLKVNRAFGASFLKQTL